MTKEVRIAGTGWKKLRLNALLYRSVTFAVLIFGSIFLCAAQTKDTTKAFATSHKISFELKGRHVVSCPPAPTDIFEKGIVFVEIVVDHKGNVIQAKPGQRGSTTLKATLLAKARQAALLTKFNPIPEATDQVGTLTFAIDIAN
ncbi:MAG: hypothetical protein JWO09_2346 [Bacteroidetes bacterium]|nr:hypothetical protein [Bacteroidota bacterium]